MLIDNEENTMDDKSLISKGKRLAYLLRHDKLYSFDKYGWRSVSELIDKQHFTLNELELIVGTNDKHRYEFSNDKQKIRARQGHSVDVDVELKQMVPPEMLYHGTAIQYMDSIKANGILKMRRQYVHLSLTKDDAVKVGSRHGSPFVLAIDTKRMYNDGCVFYLSNNGVWLTDYVAVKYIIKTQ